MTQESPVSEEGHRVRGAGPGLARIEVDFVAKRVYGFAGLWRGGYPRNMRQLPTRIDAECYRTILQRALRTREELTQVLVFNRHLVCVSVVEDEPFGVFRERDNRWHV